MRWERRPARGLGMLYGAVLALAAALAAVWTRAGLPIPACRLRQWTGIACPTCGSTRMVESILTGDIAAAFACNPFVFAGLAAVGLWGLASAACRITRVRALRPVLRPGEVLALRLAVIATFALSWAYVIWRDFRS
jgi:hypothetical protein